MSRQSKKRVSRSSSDSKRPIAGRPNTLLRLLVPLVLGLGGIGVAVAVWVNSTNRPSHQPQQPQQSSATQPATPVQNATETTPQASSTDAPSTDAPTPEPSAAPTEIAGDTPTEPDPVPTANPDAEVAAPDAPVGSYRAQTFADTPWSAPTLGGLDTKDAPSPYEAQITFSPTGAGVEELRLAKHYETVKKQLHALVMAERQYAAGRLTPMAVLGVEINGAYVALTGSDNIWRPITNAGGAPIAGAFEAFVLDDAGDRAVRIERRYVLDEGSFDIRVRQFAQNLTAESMRLRLYQAGPVDLRQESFYGGDKRRVRFGYFLDPQRDPSQSFVQADGRLAGRGSLLGSKTNGYYAPEAPVWPSNRSIEKNWTLVWAAFTNRYFGVAVHPILAGEAGLAPRPLEAFDQLDRVLADTVGGEGMMLRMRTPDRLIEAGQRLGFSHGVYAGPLSRPEINDEAIGKPLNLGKMVAYNLGGPCAICTFAWLADSLHSVMLIAHDYLVHDWALAIILLVIVVRTVLHPITRWSQIRMQRFGKQMQGMAPKQKKLQEKYKDDPKKLQQEMGKLWREEGVNPAGLLGCLPMLLQTPVWIALYAVLYYSFEMRHSPAFYGVFQNLTGGAWPFLADLAQPDTLIPFGRSFDLGIVTINSFNILPLLLGVVFFLHQKYLTPPTSTQMTPEQESQQKMIKVMMVVMFPIFMYAAPSGLALYFVTNSTIAIFENKHIRSSAEKKGLLDPQPKTKKPRKPGGFMDRLQTMVEEQQRKREEEQAGPGKANLRAQQDAMRDRERKPKGLPQPKRKKKK